MIIQTGNIPIAYCRYGDICRSLKKTKEKMLSSFLNSIFFFVLLVPRAGLEPAQPSLAKGF